jgi:hypothetical protein
MIQEACPAVKRRLPAFHDGELSIEEQVRVEAHLRGCAACAAEAASYRAVGEMLREGAKATPVPPALLDGLAQAVVSRMKAENDESLPGRVNRMFEDLHLVWAALGATGSAVACIALIVGILSFAVSRERPDSLAGVMTAMASPPGSDLNPIQLNGRMVPPRAYEDDLFPAMIGESDTQLTLAASVRCDGLISNLELLQGVRSGEPKTAAAERRDMVDLLDAISKARFEPARSGGAPVAVNMIWMLAHLTVRGKPPGETHQLSPRIDISVTYHLA